MPVFVPVKLSKQQKRNPNSRRSQTTVVTPSEVFGKGENDSMPEFRLLMKTAQSSTAEYLLKLNQFQKHALSTHWLNQTQFSQIPTMTFPHSAATPHLAEFIFCIPTNIKK